MADSRKTTCVDDQTGPRKSEPARHAIEQSEAGSAERVTRQEQPSPSARRTDRIRKPLFGR